MVVGDNSVPADVTELHKPGFLVTITGSAYFYERDHRERGEGNG